MKNQMRFDLLKWIVILVSVSYLLFLVSDSPAEGPPILAKWNAVAAVQNVSFHAHIVHGSLVLHVPWSDALQKGHLF